MAVSYNIIDSLCKQKGSNVTEVCKLAKVPRSALSDYKAGRKKSISQDNLEKIANELEVDVNTFFDEPQSYCLLCGSDAFDIDESGMSIHKEKHAKWEAAVHKFGFCWPIRIRESIKAQARNRISTESLSPEELKEEHIKIFKALFSRSLEASGYNLEHPTFQEYSAMLLHQPSWAMSIDNDAYHLLTDEFGTTPGISTGTYFYTAEYTGNKKAPIQKDERKVENPDIRMIARAGKKMTPEQAENLRKYAQYMFPEAFEDDDT